MPGRRSSERPIGAPVLPFGGCAGFARRSLSSSGARSNLRMIDCISSAFGASMKAKPLDSWVSGLRITLIESATRASAFNHDWMSSAVTQVGKLPRKTVKLIRWGVSLTGDLTKVGVKLQSSGSFYATTKSKSVQRIQKFSSNFFSLCFEPLPDQPSFHLETLPLADKQT